MSHYHAEAGQVCGLSTSASRSRFLPLVSDTQQQAIDEMCRRLGCVLNGIERAELEKTGHVTVGATWIRIDECDGDGDSCW